MKLTFDMDGTFVDLYGVENWLEKLQSSNPEPYRVANPLVNLAWFARTLNELQAAGFEIEIVSWLAGGSSKEYEILVTEAKLNWLKKHLPSVTFNEIHIVSHGTPKQSFNGDFLFDDEEKNRLEWIGQAFDEKDLIKKLRTILKNAEIILN